MKKRTVFYTLLLVAVCALATFSLVRKIRLHRMSNIAVRAASVLPKINPSGIQEIKFHWRDTETTLKKKNGIWLVAERADFLADQKKVLSFLDTVSKMRALKIITPSDEATMTRLRVLPESNKPHIIPGVRVTLKDGKQDVVLDIVMGRGHFVKLDAQVPRQGPQTPDGRYFAILKKNGETDIILSPTVYETFHPTPGSWLQSPNMRALTDTVDMTYRELARTEPIWAIQRTGVNTMFLPHATAKDVRVSTEAVRTIFGLLNAHYIIDAFPKQHYKDAGLPFASLTLTTPYGLKQALLFRRIKNTPGRILFSVEAEAVKPVKAVEDTAGKLAREFTAGRENVYYEIPEELFNVLRTPPYESTKKETK